MLVIGSKERNQVFTLVLATRVKKKPVCNQCRRVSVMTVSQAVWLSRPRILGGAMARYAQISVFAARVYNPRR
jgi:ribosomal protein L37AE/L43A